MPHKIERLCSVTGSYSLTATAADNAKIPYGAAASGMVVVDAASGATSLNWYVAFGPELTPNAAYSGASAVTTSITAGRAYPVPAELAGAPFIVAATNSGTATIRLSVKG